jgi:RNA polymerase-binding transcription factor DksA
MAEYGVCQQCHGTLAFHQLTADPLATQCVSCLQGQR